MNRYISLAVLAGVMSIAACDKNGRQDISGPVSGAKVKFFNYGVGAPGVNFYAGTQKITAISSTSCSPPADTTAACRGNGIESTTGTAYNAIGSGGNYNAVSSGTVTLAAKISAATDNGLAISSVSANLDDSKFYSYFVSGVYNTTTKAADAFVVEDQLPTSVDYSQAYVRLVNASSNAGTEGLYAKNTTTGVEVAVGSQVAYKAAGAFTAIPAGVYDLTTRTSSTGTGIAAAAGVSFVGGHVYTVIVRGDASSTVAANKPALTASANQ